MPVVLSTSSPSTHQRSLLYALQHRGGTPATFQEGLPAGRDQTGGCTISRLLHSPGMSFCSSRFGNSPWVPATQEGVKQA